MIVARYDNTLSTYIHIHTIMCFIILQAQTLSKLALLHSPQTAIYEITNPCVHIDKKFQLVKARCDMETDGGGWTVILRRRRHGPHAHFNKGWNDYEKGFGDPRNEYWIGLRNIHCLTQRDNVDLLIDLRFADGNGMIWIYNHFKVAGSDDNYRISIGGGIGPSGAFDAMFHLNGSQFTTRDSDHDLSSTNCALRVIYGVTYGGGWWHSNCYYAQLTGPHNYGLYWYKGSGTVTLTSSYSYYVNAEMKIRPKSCNKECS